MVDLGFVGRPFTWTSKSKKLIELTKTRSDRAWGNNLWLKMFPNSKLFHIRNYHSDHDVLNTKLMYSSGKNNTRPF